eukprot:GFYU01011731.1.p1 GENE.GFYU01011731.1~~GFYU01011731.1.p1  ORF type:complete len:252 (-),score=32.49 GFYU01011731.1:223-978(-)
MSFRTAPENRNERCFTPRPLALTISAVAVTLRLIPHLHYVTPLHAFALYCGARLHLGVALTLSLGQVVLTDVLIAALTIPQEGSDQFVPFTLYTPFNYVSVLASFFIGYAVLSKSSEVLKVAAGSFLGSTQFFLIYVFGKWLAQEDTQDADTLGTLFSEEIVHYAIMVAADQAIGMLLFGGHFYISRTWFPKEHVDLNVVRELLIENMDKQLKQSLMRNIEVSTLPRYPSDATEHSTRMQRSDSSKRVSFV